MSATNILYPIFITLNGAYGALHVRADAVTVVESGADEDGPRCDVLVGMVRFHVNEPAADVLSKIADALAVDE